MSERGWLVSWSPDAAHYTAAVAGSKKITIVEKSTGETSSVPLEGSFTWLRDIDWSPTGKFLAFVTADEAERNTLWTIPPGGGEQNKIIEETVRIWYPRWSGDGAAIYYLPGQDTTDLWKVRLDPDTGRAVGRPSVVLTGLEMHYWSLSRDDKKLVYSKKTGHSNLWLVTLPDGAEGEPAETRQLTSGTFQDSYPRLAPDGRQFAFERGGDIYVMPLDDGPARQLTFMESRESSPAWSPDGKWIAFASYAGGTPRVWKIPARGGTPRPFEKTKLSGGFGLRRRLTIRWAPGSKILYQRPGNRNFHLLDPNTGEEAPLIKDDSVGWAAMSEYSPDGTRIAIRWARHESSTSGVWTISVEDSTEARIHDSSAMPIGWSGDGTWIYAWDSRSTPSRAVKIPATGGEAETILEWPFTEEEGSCVPASTETQWVCEVRESSTDIWLVENFDPEVN